MLGRKKSTRVKRQGHHGSNTLDGSLATMRNPRLAGKEKQPHPPGPTERKGKKTFSLAKKAYLNSLFEAGLRSASKSQRPFLEKASCRYWSYDIPSSCKSVSPA